VIFLLKYNLAAECKITFQKVLKDCPNLKTIYTDNISEFLELFHELIISSGIIHHFGRSHTSQGQKQIKRFNITFKNYIAQYFQKYNTKLWVPAIQAFLKNYNNRIHTTTKEIQKIFLMKLLPKNYRK
jgi:transposase InsO family protein